jgi:A/G-specific adenine glycosylase
LPDPDALLAWYGRVARPLPWRATRDPYALLVSEVMLQQTQAARVVPYYEAWLARWATPASLAAAGDADVLRAWSGLGYNRRALALKRAAAEVAARGWPADLTELPGVGPYTAAAVGSFAWDRQVAAVDTNVRRVHARWGSVPPLPPGRAAAYNQAMMELGATVCTARAAHCGRCPVVAGCPSAGRVEIPPRRRRGSGGRFEDSTRYARGRVLHAALHGGDDGLAPERRAAARASLLADGLLPGGPGAHAG